MTGKQLKIIGWGYEGEEISADEHRMITARFSDRFDGDFEIREAPADEEAIRLHPPCLYMSPALAPFSSIAKRDRLVHTYGKSFTDYVRQFDGDFSPAPDIVAFASSEADIMAVY